MTLAQVLTLAVALGTALFGVALLLPQAPRGLLAFPKMYKVGCVLSATAWIWTALQLGLHPIDFLAFLTPTVLVVGTLVCVPLTWYLLENLLSVRGLGALLMLFPMPVLIAVREDVSAWRLLPVSVSYAALTLGMVLVFHPWTGRVLCEKLAGNAVIRKSVGGLCLVLGLLMAIGTFMLGEVIGQ